MPLRAVGSGATRHRAIGGRGGGRAEVSNAGWLAHRVRDATTTGAIPSSKHLEGDQSPGRVGRAVTGNGGHRYGPIRGATPRRCCITGLPARASRTATRAADRSAVVWRQTPRRQRSWRHDAAAGGGHPQRGTNRAARTPLSRGRRRVDLPQGGPARGVEPPRPGEKRSEPQDRQRDATSPHIQTPASAGTLAPATARSGGENRRGRAKRRGRNGIARWHLATEAAAAMSSREWTPRITSMEGRKARRVARRFGSNVGGGTGARGESHERRSETPDQGCGTRTLKRREATRAGARPSQRCGREPR